MLAPCCLGLTPQAWSDSAEFKNCLLRGTQRQHLYWSLEAISYCRFKSSPSDQIMDRYKGKQILRNLKLLKKFAMKFICCIFSIGRRCHLIFTILGEKRVLLFLPQPPINVKHIILSTEVNMNFIWLNYLLLVLRGLVIQNNRCGQLWKGKVDKIQYFKILEKTSPVTVDEEIPKIKFVGLL